MTYIAAENRYESIPYRRVGRSGLVLPALSLKFTLVVFKIQMEME